MAALKDWVDETIDDATGEPETDAELVARARRDCRAFAPLYERYADPVYRFCFRRLGDPDAAADATAKVFTKALVGLPGFRGASFRAWLFSIAHNSVVDDYRERRSDLPLEAAAGVIDPSASPELAAIDAERRALLRGALVQLLPEQRQIVELRLAGLSVPEIAHVLDRSESAIKSSQHRAYARLRRILGLTLDQEHVHAP